MGSVSDCAGSDVAACRCACKKQTASRTREGVRTAVPCDACAEEQYSKEGRKHFDEGEGSKMRRGDRGRFDDEEGGCCERAAGALKQGLLLGSNTNSRGDGRVRPPASARRKRTGHLARTVSRCWGRYGTGVPSNADRKVGSRVMVQRVRRATTERKVRSTRSRARENRGESG